MAVNDFSNQNIQDTYQRVVQTDGTNLADGTGSLLPISFEGNDVIVPGALKAQSYIVSESIINVSSGSTIFGDSIDDSHSFNGAITASGGISSSGTMTALSMSGDGSNLTGIVSASHAGTANTALTATTATNGFSNALTVSTGLDLSGNAVNFNGSSARTLTLDLTEVITDDGANRILTSDGDGTLTAESAFLVNGGAVTLNGSLSASSFLQTATLRGDQNLSTGLQVDGYVLAQNITSSGDISASGDIFASRYKTDGFISLNTDGSTQGRVFGDANITGIQIGRDGTTNKNIELLGPVTASGNISASGNVISSKVVVDNGIEHKGDNNTKIEFPANDTIDLNTNGVVRARIDNDGVNINSGRLNVNSHITASGNISASGNIIATSFDARNTSEGFLLQGAKILYTDGDGHHHIGNHNVPLALTGSSIEIGHAGDTGLHITASGNISASGNILATRTITSNISAPGSLSDRIELLDDFINIHGGDSGADSKVFFTVDDLTDKLFINKNSADIDFQVNTDTSRAIFVDGGNDRFFIGNSHNNFQAFPLLYSNAVENRFTSTVNIANYGFDSNNNGFQNTGLNENFPEFNLMSGSLLRVIGHTPSGYNPISASIHMSSSFGNIQLNDGHITASGNISASGDLIVNNINGIIDGGTF